jgi:hypothetical protein
MRIKTISTVSAAGAGSAVKLMETPFIGEGVALFNSPAANFNGSVQLEGSEDGTTWAALAGATFNTAGSAAVPVPKFPRYVRTNCTAFTSGAVVVSILA